MKPTTKMKIKTALLIVAIHLTLAIIADIWLDIKMYIPLAVSGSLLYMQALSSIRKKELQQQEQQ